MDEEQIEILINTANCIDNVLLFNNSSRFCTSTSFEFIDFSKVNVNWMKNNQEDFICNTRERLREGIIYPSNPNYYLFNI
jgi:hypothetical protein